ncbi:MAG: hypothetical protein H8E44_21295 [Planctomycetes bacterium]|nr:hypothetical protein [Planctomycetota bacterium]
MNVKQVSDPQTPIGDVLSAASSDGVLIESEGETAYAVLPLNEDLVDHLLEHNPRFIRECEEIRQRMASGRFHSHEEVKRLLAEEPGAV